MKLEYLVLVPNHDSFCNTKKAFMDFLKVDSLVGINGQTLSYKKTVKGKVVLTTKIRVETDLVPSKDERYFLIVLEAREDDDVDLFSELGEKIKSISMRLNPTSTVINTIWNDVGRYYAQKAYPIINEIENMMRKLISKFMLINVGINWSKDAVHPDLFKKIEGYSEEEVYSNDLYKLDFIHLAEVLFKKKRDLTIEQMDRLLQKTDFGENDKEIILRYIPRSNWDKYFISILDGDGSQLEAKWNRLYRLRNKVAHNRFITKAEYQEIIGICSEIKQLLISALNKLGEIDLDVEERESVVLSYHSQSPAAIGYRSEKAVAEFFLKNGFEVSSDDVYQNNYLDFLAVKDAKTSGVYVANVSVRNIYPSVRMLLKGNQSSRNVRMNRLTLAERLNFDIYEEVKVYYVLRNLESDSMDVRYIDRIKEIISDTDSRIEVVFGYLDEEGLYQTIEFW